MPTQSNQGGRGSNLTDEDRKKGGKHSHGGQGSGKKEAQGSNLSNADRKKGGQNSHVGQGSKGK